MMDMQAYIDGMSVKWQEERSASQMTLGGLIKHLEGLPEGVEVDGLSSPVSYRGYYIDLAFELTGKKETAKSILPILRGCMGEVFEGYKGGDFSMGSLTPIWIASYGDCGERIMSVSADGKIITAPEEDDDE